ncbi:hypothetical protein A1Q2_01950 [Trichosporon asahii var. asahii CBS 8904]|uniref:NADH-ubiquinone oxidoreductase n=1 Tax=Trichosporon asahii var. asahii (strain CBS 8904) TaxID=1220162 RepID=K1WRW4_TRIAC|nr:hypothetical protein A1Q2_01950 [Trichosporon asahii var. asahii CBS 8904]
MSTHREAVRNDQPYSDPNPMPKSVPHVDELGTTSAPLKSASFFIGDYCKEYNGKCQRKPLRRGREKEGKGTAERDGTTAKAASTTETPVGIDRISICAIVHERSYARTLVGLSWESDAAVCQGSVACTSALSGVLVLGVPSDRRGPECLVSRLPNLARSGFNSNAVGAVRSASPFPRLSVAQQPGRWNVANPTEDFMLCKNENRDPEHCLAEGRKVTRCAQAVITKLRENCLQEFDNHWKCLENNNQYLHACRKDEKKFNDCVFAKLGWKKNIPGSPEGEPQVFEKKNPIYTRVQK